MARKPKIYRVDFNALECKAGNYKTLNYFEREIIDQMVNLNDPIVDTLSPQQLVTLDLVYEAAEGLTIRQKEVLRLSFGLGDDEQMTEHQIAERLGITQQSVHKLKSRAIKTIQKKVSENSKVIKPTKSEKK